MEKLTPSYIYKVYVLRVIDGCTIVANVDLGFNKFEKEITLKLFDVEINNKSDEDKRQAKKYLTDLINSLSIGDEKYFLTKTHKRRDEYYVELSGSRKNLPISINREMVRTGHATSYLL